MVPPSLSFAAFCELLHSIACIPPVKAGREPDAVLVKSCFSAWVEVVTRPGQLSPGTGVQLFRLLFPEEGTRRRYDMKETLLAKAIVVHYRQAGHPLDPVFEQGWNETELDLENSRSSGCLGLELREHLAGNSFAAGEITIAEVDILLDELASFSKWSSVPQRKRGRVRSDVIHDLYYRLNGHQAAFLTQIILRDLSPILYPAPSAGMGEGLERYNTKAHYKLTLNDALYAWSPHAPRMMRFTVDLDHILTRIEAGDLSGAIKLGIPVQVSKTHRPGTCKSATQDLQGWASVEQKYDGFRMQIHYDSTIPRHEQFVIFSKSTRDSTKERVRTIPLLRAILGQTLLGDERVDEQLRLRVGKRDKVVTSAIFEGELICYDEAEGSDGPFDKVQSTLEGTAGHVIQESLGTTDTDRSSQGSRWSERIPKVHLKLVFFDVLHLDGKDLVHAPYKTRRAHLEKVIQPITGYCSIAARQLVDFDAPDALISLRRFFAETITDRGEGLMIKPVDAPSNSTLRRHRTVKLKKDFIPGCGDTLDFIILGARWDQKRGNELGVQPCTLTTFYVGLLTDRQHARGKRHYVLQFTTAYGLDRKALHEVNNLARYEHGPRPFQPKRGIIIHADPDLPYTFEIAGDLNTAIARPTTMFAVPFQFELTGAGFQRNDGYAYSLRWPRITKYKNRSDDSITLASMCKVAARAMNLIDDSHDSPMALINWNRPLSCAVGPTREERRSAEVLEWIQRLERADKVFERSMTLAYSPSPFDKRAAPTPSSSAGATSVDDALFSSTGCTTSSTSSPSLCVPSISLICASPSTPLVDSTPGPPSLLAPSPTSYCAPDLSSSVGELTPRACRFSSGVADQALDRKDRPRAARPATRHKRMRSRGDENSSSLPSSLSLPAPLVEQPSKLVPPKIERCILATRSESSLPRAPYTEGGSLDLKSYRLRRQSSLTTLPPRCSFARPLHYWTIYPASFYPPSSSNPSFSSSNFLPTLDAVASAAGWKSLDETEAPNSLCARGGSVFVASLRDVHAVRDLLRRTFEVPRRVRKALVEEVRFFQLEALREQGRGIEHFLWD